MRVGDLFDQRFLLDRQAGAGGMGAVYRAFDQRDGVWVALKVLHAAGEHGAPAAGDEGDDERFMREATLLSELSHPGIVAYVAHGRDPGGRAYLAMEWLEGEDLASCLVDGPLPVSSAVAVVLAASDALAAAHARGVLHRDLKPSNLFLVGAHLDEIKILDFGIARQMAGGRGPTRTGTMVGTPGYMAPEQTRGRRELTPAADVFALGCVLYQCVTGVPPFLADHVMAVLVRILFEEPTPVAELAPEASPALAAIIERALAKDPADRYPDAAALRDALQALSSDAHAQTLVGDRVPTSVATASPTRRFADTEQGLFSVVLAVPPGDAVSGRTIITTTALVEDIGALGLAAAVLEGGTLFVSVPPIGSAIDRASLAARAALRIKERWPEARVAVATGRGALQDRTAVGDVADQAARAIERDTAGRSTASAGVLLDTLSAKLLEGRFAHTPRPMGALLLHEEREADESRRLLGKPTPCVGREAELSTLLGQLASCLEESEARAVLVTGPPGIGKSRLRHELRRRLEARGDDPPVTQLFARADLLRQGEPYGLLGAALRAFVGLTGNEPAAIQRELLANRLGRAVPDHDRQRVIVFLGELCQIPFPAETTPMLEAARAEPSIMADRLRRAFLDWLAAECAVAPVLLLLDDLHWGDLLTVATIDEALKEQKDAPFFVLALARPEVHAAFPRLLAGHKRQEIVLQALSAKACERLVRLVMDPKADTNVARIVAQSGGNALFLEELIRAVAEGGSDEQPATVLAMLQARLGHFDTETRRTAQAAALFGETFWRAGVGKVLGRAEASSALGQSLDTLTAAEIIQLQPGSRLAHETEYAFRHALVRDAAYQLLTPDDLATGHGLAASFLETAGEQDAAVVADHLERAGERARAASFYLRAAEASLEKGDLSGVVRLTERGVACGAEGELLGDLAATASYAQYWLSAQHAMGASANVALDRVAAGTRAECRALMGAVSHAFFNGDAPLGGALLRRLLAFEPTTASQPNYPEALYGVSFPVHFGAPLPVMNALLERLAYAVGLVESSSPTTRRYFLAMRAMDSVTRHARPWTAWSDAEHALSLARDAGDRRLELMLPIGVLGWCGLELGMADAMIARLRPLATKLASTQEGVASHIYYTVLAHLVSEGDDEALWDEAERGLLPILTLSDRLFPAMARWGLCRLALRRGDHHGAEAHARQAMTMFPHLPVLLPRAAAVQIRALVALDRATEACALADAVFARLPHAGGFGHGELEVRLAAAEAFWAAGERPRARALLASCAEQVRVRSEDIPSGEHRERYLIRNRACVRTAELGQVWGAVP